MRTNLRLQSSKEKKKGLPGQPPTFLQEQNQAALSPEVRLNPGGLVL
jgi:hypothetical protein